MESQRLKNRLSFVILYLLLAIVVGAFGAHALKDQISSQSAFDTGSSYHFYAALFLITHVLCQALFKEPFTTSFWLFLCGSLCFSVSLYFLCLGDTIPQALTSVMGPITPIGGSLMVIGLALFALKIWRRQ